MEIAELKKAHKLLAEFDYNITAIDKGYTDKILYINLGENDDQGEGG
jgi:aldehyde:ferredoxin oxidoreductase